MVATSHIFGIFTPTWGNNSILTNIFQRGRNHQQVCHFLFFSRNVSCFKIWNHHPFFSPTILELICGSFMSWKSRFVRFPTRWHVWKRFLSPSSSLHFTPSKPPGSLTEVKAATKDGSKLLVVDSDKGVKVEPCRGGGGAGWVFHPPMTRGPLRLRNYGGGIRSWGTSYVLFHHYISVVSYKLFHPTSKWLVLVAVLVS